MKFLHEDGYELFQVSPVAATTNAAEGVIDSNTMQEAVDAARTSAERRDAKKMENAANIQNAVTQISIR